MAKSEIKVWLKLHGKEFQRGLQRAKKDLSKFRAGANNGMQKLATGFIAAAGASAMIGAKFEKAMKNVQSVSGASAEELRKLENSARKMGSTTAFSAQEAAEAQYALASAGLNTSQIISSLPAVLNYAGATQAELADTAEATTSAMAMFGLSAADSNDIVNTFAAGIAATPLTMERLSEAMSQGGSTAAALGLSLEETTAGLGLLHSAGVKGAKAGTYFRSTLLGMNEAAASGKGAVGEALAGWDSSTEGLAGALQRLETAGVTGKMALEEMGAKGGPALAAMLSQGSEALIGITNKVTGSNQAFDAYNVQMDSTVGRFDIFKSTLQEAALQIWDTIKGPVNQAITGLTKFISDNFSRIKQVFMNVVNKVMYFAAIVGKVFSFIQKHSTTFEIVGKALLAVGAALYVAVTATAAWNAVLAVNPITLIILGIAALIAIIAVVVDKLGGWRVVWLNVVAGFKIGFEAIKLYLKVFMANLKLVGNVLVALGQSVVIIFTGMWNTIKAVGEKIAMLFKSIWEIIKNPRKAKQAFADLKAQIAVGLSDPMAEAKEQLDSVWSSVGGNYKNELIEIKNQTAANVKDIVNATRAEVDKIRKEREAAKATTSETLPAGTDVPDTEPLDLPELTMPELGETAVTKFAETNKLMSDIYAGTWDTMLQSDLTGSEKRAAIWSGMRDKTVGVISDMAKKWVWGEMTQLAGTEAKESGMSVAVLKNAAIRIGAKIKEMAIDMKAGVVNAWNATTGFFKAYSGIPFLGPILAGAAVAAMFKLMGKAKKALFYDGGYVTGPAGRDKVNAGLTAGEYVMPVGATKKYGSILESMRAGNFNPQTSLMPVGSGTMQITAPVTVQISEGSLLLADDDMSIRRFAEKINDVIVERVQATYSEGE